MIVAPTAQPAVVANADKPATNAAANAGEVKGDVPSVEPEKDSDKELFGGGWADVDGGDWEAGDVDGEGAGKEVAAAVDDAGVNASEGVPKTGNGVVGQAGTTTKDVSTENSSKKKQKKKNKKKGKGGAVVADESSNGKDSKQEKEEEEEHGDKLKPDDGEPDHGEDEVDEKGNLRPPLVKKKAAKRRAQRKKAAEAAKAAIAEALTETATPGSSSKAVGARGKRGRSGGDVEALPKGQAKRKRGKYVARRKSGE